MSLCLLTGTTGVLTFYQVCLLPWLQEKWYDQSEHVPQNLQVWTSYLGQDMSKLTCCRVGDIVDVKANGAVQKGFAGSVFWSNC